MFKLHQYGIRGLKFDLNKSYLNRKRKQLVQVGNHSSSTFGTKIGVPHGSVLVPIFFLIYINYLTYTSNLKVTLYADDSVLYWIKKNTDFLPKKFRSKPTEGRQMIKKNNCR